MDVIRRTDLERLALQGAGPSVSLFLPTHRAGPEAQQAPIRLKNLLREATEALQADGVKAPMIDSVLAPLRRLVNDRLFWQYQRDGLALYSRPGWWRALRVPWIFPSWRWWRPVPHQPPAAAADRRRSLLRRGPQPGGIFHGYGSAGDVQKDRVLRYFRKVNRALREVLAGERAPMVLAAVEHLAPLWRQVNTYPLPCGCGAGRWERRGGLPVLARITQNRID
jgi:hypothetical protein